MALLAGMPGVLAPPAAHAQEQVARTAAVLDFANRVERSPLMGRDVSSAVALSLSQNGFTVTPRAMVVDALAKLGLHPPFEADNIRQIAKELDVQKVYGGSALYLRETKGPRPRVRAWVGIEEYDGPTGDMVNGSYGRGEEEIKGGGESERDVARAAAIDRAVAKGFEGIRARTLITGAVMTYKPEGGKVMINRGLKQGVADGMLFDVFRAKLDEADPLRTISVKVGRIKVTTVSSDDAEATVVYQTQGVNQRDQLREVFQLNRIEIPSQDSEIEPQVHEEAPSARNPMYKLLAPLLGVVLGAGMLFFLATMWTHTVQDAPKVAAGSAYLTQSSDGQNPSIVFSWGDRNWAPPVAYIGGYVVYRGSNASMDTDEGSAVGATSGAKTRSFSDNNEWTNKTIPINCNYQDSAGKPVTATTNLTIVHLSPQPGQQYYYKVRRLGPPMPTTPPSLISRAQGRSAALRGAPVAALNPRNSLRTRGNVFLSPIRFTGITPNGRQVTVLNPPAAWNNALDPATDNAVAPPATIALSEPSQAAGPVHYIVPPQLTAPLSGNQAMTVNDITFQFEGELGATEYLVQIAADPLFRSLVFAGQMVTTATGPLNYRFNEAQPGFHALSALTTYYWRVGARRTGETPPTGGYVWSNDWTFTTADQAPPPPGRGFGRR